MYSVQVRPGAYVADRPQQVEVDALKLQMGGGKSRICDERICKKQLV